MRKHSINIELIDYKEKAKEFGETFLYNGLFFSTIFTAGWDSLTEVKDLLEINYPELAAAFPAIIDIGFPLSTIILTVLLKKGLEKISEKCMAYPSDFNDKVEQVLLALPREHDSYFGLNIRYAVFIYLLSSGLQLSNSIVNYMDPTQTKDSTYYLGKLDHTVTDLLYIPIGWAAQEILSPAISELGKKFSSFCPSVFSITRLGRHKEEQQPLHKVNLNI